MMPPGTLLAQRLGPPAPRPVFYPVSDGQPMANNSEHWNWIVYLTQGLEYLFRERDDICPLSDVLWYPVEGQPKICVAPDVQVTLGRPPGPRQSYKQWEEEGLPPQFVVEFLSASNTAAEMTRKALFFDQYGVEEYVLYDIEHGDLEVMVREGGQLRALPQPLREWTSRLLGIHLRTDQHGILVISGPDGKKLPSFSDWVKLAEQEKSRAAAAVIRADAAEARAEKLAAKLRELGLDPAGL